MCGLGNRKNDAFNVVLARDSITPYPGSVALLDVLREDEDAGRGRLVVGQRARRARRRRPGRPVRHRGRRPGRHPRWGCPASQHPDTFVHAATECGTTPARSVVVEDAVSGVRAGAAGAFGLVIGVDRGAGADTLTAAGADLVVADLEDLA